MSNDTIRSRVLSASKKMPDRTLFKKTQNQAEQTHRRNIHARIMFNTENIISHRRGSSTPSVVRVQTKEFIAIL
ncbi:hypothetical protein KIN20_029592 [Parelaphostrongylus tenuis]|uniref:Uncharacterized protein n=1 Tax=Parelaphostrongylus tenuis TaxID=148309 RepID=A0AAD5R2Q7_PARTN|nr:hypothetical protein KIN20_029592 [Parelaphostrongylus tenuis]